jgi:putative nucleotidyltransferase with HDIG domain
MRTAQECVDRAGQVRPLPAIALEVARLADDPTSSARDLERLIESDPDLSRRIIHSANAPYFQPAGEEVRSVRRAVVTIGLASTKNLALGLCVQQAFSQHAPDSEFNRWQFWCHSLAAAAAARLIARLLQDATEDVAFLAGLLHDIGKPLMDEVVGDAATRALNAAGRTGKQVWETERAILGFDHAEVGGLAAAKWKIPTPAAQAIALHHRPNPQPADGVLAPVIQIADAIAHAGGYGFHGNVPRPAISSSACAAIGLAQDNTQEVAEVLDSHVANVMDAFGIGAEGSPASLADHEAGPRSQRRAS